MINLTQAMHKPYIAQLVYNATFPRPRPGIDPPSFAAHVVRNLVPEVQIETSTFYGALDYIEAQYPGLDYTHKPHRMRLSRFTWHRRLFRVFDQLRLTDSEISSLCSWKGTKSARERFEREMGIKVIDTTACGVAPSPTLPPSVEVHYLSDSGAAKMDPETERAHDTVTSSREQVDTGSGSGYAPECTLEEIECSSDDEMESYGIELNNRLIAASAAREQGANVPLDDAWEQWMKEVVEQRSYAELRNAVHAPPFVPASSPSSSPHLRYLLP